MRAAETPGVYRRNDFSGVITGINLTEALVRAEFEEADRGKVVGYLQAYEAGFLTGQTLPKEEDT